MTRTTTRRRRPTLEALEGRALLSTIRGSLFEDLSGNGVRDPGDPGLPLAGVTVYLDQNRDGVLDPGEPSTTTAADGSYSFTGLGAGTYPVAQVAPTGTTQTAPAPDPGPGQLGDITRDMAPPAHHPYGLASVGASDPNAGLYVVANNAAGTEGAQIYRIDPASGATLGSIPAAALSGYWFRGLTYDGQDFWGTDLNNDLIVEFDPSGQVVRSYAAPSPGVEGIAWDGQALWVSAFNSPISRIDPASGQVLFTIPSPSAHTLALAFDGSHLWASANEAGEVVELDPSTGAVLRSITSPGSTNDDINGLTYDGQRLWVSLRGENVSPERLLQVDISRPGEQAVTLDGTSDASGVDFGDFRLGSISGTVTDGTGAPLAGWHVYLANPGSDGLDPWERSALTDANGHYTIGGLAPGTYNLTELVRGPGWTPSGPTTSAVTIGTSGQAVTGADFTDVLTGIGPINPESLVNTTTAGTQHVTSVNSVASDGQGHSVVVWQGPYGSGSGVFARVYAANGAPLTGEILVNSVASGSQHNVVVSMNASGTFAVGWACNFNVYARTFGPNGAAKINPVTVFTPTRSTVGNSYGIGIDAQGYFDVDYYTGASSSYSPNVQPTDWVQRYSPSGAAQWRKPLQVGTTNTINGGGSAFAMKGDGSFVVAFESNSSINAQRYSVAGQALGGRIAVAASGSLLPSIAMDAASGNFVVAWEDNGLGGRAARLYRADGTALGSTFLYTPTGAGSGETYPIAMDSSGIVVTYPLNGNVVAQRFSADGNWTPIDARPFLVNTTLGNVPDGTTGLVAAASVVMTGNGTFVIVWCGAGLGDDSGVFLQRYGTA